MKPFVSVIVPAYNMAVFTVKTVMSLIGQTYPGVEIIVVDDGSSDNTGKLLDRFSDRITYLYRENGGACSARNVGFQASKGNLLAFLDCDDLYHPEKVERFVEAFERNPRAGMVYSPEYLIDRHDRIIGINGLSHHREEEIFLPLLKGNFIGSSTPIIRREVLENVGLWDEEIFTTADWDLWLRITRGYRAIYIDSPLSYSRQVSRYNQRNRARTRKEAYYVLGKFERIDLPAMVLKESRSNIEILLHRYAYQNGEYGKSTLHLRAAITARPIQIKAYLFLVLSTIFRSIYRRILNWRTWKRIDCQHPSGRRSVSWIKS